MAHDSGATPGDYDDQDPAPDRPGASPAPEPGASAASGEDDGSWFGTWEELENALAAAKERAELLAGFAPGGAWDACPPGPELAAAVARAAKSGWTCPAAGGDELVGLLRAMAKVQSWASAGLLGMVRALIRDDALPADGVFGDGEPGGGTLPDRWDDSLAHEVALALAVSVGSADKAMRVAWELGARLPGIELLLADGTLDLPRARLVTEVFAGLSDADAARAEALLLPHLTEPPRKTWTQIQKLAMEIAALVDPELAERRRKAAEKHGARVRMFREPTGAAGLSGRDLPTDQTLAAYASVAARAIVYKESAAFPGETMDRLRATAYLDLLNNLPAEARIAYGRLSPDDDDPDAGDDLDDDPDGEDREGALEDALSDDRPADDELAGPGGPGEPPQSPDGDPMPGGSDCPCRICDGRCAPPPDDGGFPDDFPGGGLPGGDNPGPCPGDDDPDQGGGAGSGSDGGPGPGDDAGPGSHGGPGPGGGTGPGAHGRADLGGSAGRGSGAEQEPGSGAGPGAPPPGPPGGRESPLTDLIVPLATLLGLGERPGEGHGLGPLDPALCRALAALAARSPRTELCVTVTNQDGIAIGHGCATPTGRAGIARPPGGPPPPPARLPARINLTITAARLTGMLARPGPPGSRAPTGWAFAPPDGLPAGNSPRTAGTALARRRRQRAPGDPSWCGTWTLTLPTGAEYAANLGPVPTFACDHRNESHAYKPNDTLRHLVQIRDHTCTFPTCNRHARESDFEHATPYDQGGRTCACNAGARSRRCHRVKQSPGWTLTQPQPGWHQWTTPRGRTYTQGPNRYPV